MKKAVIYPGRFQPMLPHHEIVYKKLQAEFPDADVYIATSDKVALPKSPLNFREKRAVILKHGIRNITEFFRAFFREFLLLMLLVPYLRFISIFLILIYSFYYTKNVYISEYNNPRIFLLPFINLSLLFISFFYSIKGFATGKQKL